MDPDERQRQREARRRARMEKTNDDNPQESSTTENETPNVQESYQREEDDGEENRRRQQEMDEEEERLKKIEKEKAERLRRLQEEEQEEQERAERQRQREIEEAKQKKMQESEKKKKPEKKRKGLGGLSPEKKRLLKQLILQKAAEEMKAEAKKRQEEKENHLKKVVPKLEIDVSSIEEITKIVKSFYAKMYGLEEEKYDWEVKLRSLDFEINELTLKVNNVKGKFVKPVLKRVSKTEGKWSKLEKSRGQNQISFRDQLKSTGQNKFALEEKEDTHKSQDWRDHLKSKDADNADEALEIQTES